MQTFAKAANPVVGNKYNWLYPTAEKIPSKYSWIPVVSEKFHPKYFVQIC